LEISYLTGNQLMSESRVDCYENVLMRSGRLLELDCHNGSDGEPQVYHGKTLTSRIYFKDIIIAVKKYAFVKSE
jgi:phosphatidylinositol phospholipase C, delta